MPPMASNNAQLAAIFQQMADINQVLGGNRFKTIALEKGARVLKDFVKQRYSSYDSGIGAKIEDGSASFADLEAYMLEKGEADPNQSGRQEMLENLVNQYL